MKTCEINSRAFFIVTMVLLLGSAPLHSVRAEEVAQSQHRKEAETFSMVMGGAGIGVLTTAFVLDQSNLLVRDEGEIRDFDTKTLFIVGAVMTAVGVIAGVTSANTDSGASAENDTANARKGEPGSWRIVLSSYRQDGLGIGIRSVF